DEFVDVRQVHPLWREIADLDRVHPEFGHLLHDPQRAAGVGRGPQGEEESLVFGRTLARGGIAHRHGRGWGGDLELVAGVLDVWLEGRLLREALLRRAALRLDGLHELT